MLFIDSLRAFHYDCRRDANKYNSSNYKQLTIIYLILYYEVFLYKLN